MDVKHTFRVNDSEFQVLTEARGEGERRWIEERFRDRDWVTAVGGYGVTTEMLRLVELSGKLVRPLLDALRNAADLDGLTIYDLLADAGIIRREPYDPEAHGASDEDGLIPYSEPGEEIWVLTELGKRFAGKEG